MRVFTAIDHFASKLFYTHSVLVDTTVDKPSFFSLRIVMSSSIEKKLVLQEAQL